MASLLRKSPRSHTLCSLRLKPYTPRQHRRRRRHPPPPPLQGAGRLGTGSMGMPLHVCMTVLLMCSMRSLFPLRLTSFCFSEAVPPRVGPGAGPRHCDRFRRTPRQNQRQTHPPCPTRPCSTQRPLPRCQAPMQRLEHLFRPCPSERARPPFLPRSSTCCSRLFFRGAATAASRPCCSSTGN